VRRMRGERGAGTLENLGVVTIAAILVVAVLLAFAGFRYGDELAAALCRITAAISGGDGASCGTGAPERSAEDYVPPAPCVVSGNGSSVSGSVAVGIQVGGGTTVWVEELGDGRFRVTKTDDSSVGVEGGFGFDVSAVVNDNRYGVAATAGGSINAAMRSGDVYYADDEGELEDIIWAETDDTLKDQLVGDDWFGRDAVDWVTEQVTGELAEPESTFVRAGVNAMGNAGATLITGDASAKVEAGIYEGTTTYRDGRTTDSFTASSSGSARASALLGDGGVTDDVSAVASYSGDLTVEVDRDADGNPTAMRIVTTGSGHADVSAWENEQEDPTYTQSTWQIPLDSEANSQTAARVLWGLGITSEGVTDTLDTFDFSGINYGGSWGDFMDLAKSEGYTWNQDYELGSASYGGNFDAAWILKAGLSAEYSNLTREATGYTYWDGTEYVERAGCMS
jgi:hypothetical protein